MRPSRLELGSLAAAAAVALALAIPSLWTAVDDAFISARYADQLVAGNGWTWSAGAAPVEGFSNPLWTLWIALGLALGAPAHGWMVGWGLAGWLSALPAAQLLAAALSDEPDARAGARLAPWLLATSPLLAVASTNGLETGWFLSSVLWASWAALVADDRHSWPAGLAVGAVAWIRPEGLLVGLVWVGWRALSGRPFRVLAGVWLGVVAALFLWRLWVFGAVLPNPVAAKVGAQGWVWIRQQNALYLWRDGWLWPVVLTALLGAALWPTRDSRRAAVVLLAATLTAPALTVELWMPAARLLTPLYALTAVLLASRIRGRGLALAIGIIVALSAFYVDPRARVHDEAHTVRPDSGAAQAARWIGRHAPLHATAALRDAGVFAFWLGTGVHTTELHERPLTRRAGPPDVHDPTLLVLTQNREDATGVRYPLDSEAFAARTAEYVYLGRVHQHHHRYYDLYVRRDAQIPALPEHLVINRLGPAPALR